MSRISLLVLLILSANLSFAQTTYTWVGGANGDYQVSANWAPVRAAPAANDILEFDVTTPVAVSNVPNNPTIGAIRIANGTSSVTFGTNIAGSNLTLSAVTPLIYLTPGKIYAGDLLGITISNAGIVYYVFWDIWHCPQVLVEEQL